MTRYRDNLVPVRVHVYRRDAVIEWKSVNPTMAGPPERGDISRLTEKSRRRLAFVAANTEVDFRTMITLTYPNEFPGDGRTVKKHLKQFLDRLRRRGSLGEYLWFMEFQRRGAPHIHLLSDANFIETADYIAAAWYETVGSGDEKHLRAGTRIEATRSGRGLSRYAVKYAMKTHQKRVPDRFTNVGRFWGHSRKVKPAPIGSVTLQEGGGDLSDLLALWKHAGKLEASPYSVLFGAGPDVVRRVAMSNEGNNDG